MDKSDSNGSGAAKKATTNTDAADKRDAKKEGAGEQKTAKDKDTFLRFKDKLTEGTNGLMDKLVEGSNDLMQKATAPDAVSDSDTSSDGEDEEDELLQLMLAPPAESEVSKSDKASTAAASASTKQTIVSAISVRNRPLPEFISIADEEAIRAQLKATKETRKKLKKLDKTVKKTSESLTNAAAGIKTLLKAFTSLSDSVCTDKSILEYAEKVSADFQQAMATFSKVFEGKIKEGVLVHTKPLRDHAKAVATLGKQRQSARNKRIKAEAVEVDMAEETQYKKTMEIREAFNAADAKYKEEYETWKERNSSEIGQFIRTFLSGTSELLKEIRAPLEPTQNPSQVPQAAEWFLSDAAQKKYTNYTGPSTSSNNRSSAVAADAPASSTTAGGSTQDRLLAKPQQRASSTPANCGAQGEVVQGVPLENDVARAAPYSSSDYVRRADPTAPSGSQPPSAISSPRQQNAGAADGQSKQDGSVTQSSKSRASPSTVQGAGKTESGSPDWDPEYDYGFSTLRQERGTASTTHSMPPLRPATGSQRGSFLQSKPSDMSKVPDVSGLLPDL